jgi:hypothetical protein
MPIKDINSLIWSRKLCGFHQHFEMVLCSAAESVGLGNLLKVGLGALALECIGQYLSQLCLARSSTL